MNELDIRKIMYNEVRHKPAKTSDYVINYQSAMAQLESIVYVLKGLA
jgi:hypothetical protein